jgi:hypothetical protein
MTDEEIIARAIENDWEMIVDEPPRPGWGTKPWSGWRRDGHGIPVGTFLGPKWETIDRKRVKTVDGPYTVTHADAMRERFADHDDRCQECGRWIEYGCSLGFERAKAPLAYCWTCKFWLDRVDELAGAQENALRGMRPDTGRPFVAQSFNYYGIGSSKTPSQHNGFGGSWWVVKFLDDGHEIETCDLWSGGMVPERFRDRLPVTAELRSGRLEKA